jgi:murein DD-endopeptidase MepM/ murein hydrolase activator NlpD
MSNRVAGRALRIAAIAGLLLGSTALAGCSSLGLGMGGGGDVTGAISPAASSGGQQSMPATLKPIGGRTDVALGPFVPPADIGGGSGGGLVTGGAPVGIVSSSSLPPLTGSDTMPAQPSLVSVSAPTQSVPLAGPAPTSPSLAVVPDNAYIHVIESGESLYTIARRYNVTAQAIVQANGMSSPDKIFVGQKVIIPGLTAKSAPAATQIASIQPVEAAPTPAAKLAPSPAMALVAPQKSTPAPTAPVEKTAAIKNPALVDPETSTTPPVAAKPALVEPVMSGADKFRWPISGKVITDFIASKGTGINIEAPEGASVRAAENGQVIYVGSGVEGYGNLVLIRHANGYVSAYAHLKAVGVSKGDNVTRGDSIGQAGMTGSVSRPQLHFELRKGATPVDPVPLLAG